MEIAGLLHDLGKLVVPNAILEKPAGLTPNEFAVIKQHTYYTYSTLGTIAGMRQIAEWAAFHHERLDGAGYPFRRDGPSISLGSRIMCVADVFTALAEDRPYRKGMTPERVTGIMQDMASRGLQDRRIVQMLLDDIDGIGRGMAERQVMAREHYSSRFEPLA